jgi:hypothetical protein
MNQHKKMEYFRLSEASLGEIPQGFRRDVKMEWSRFMEKIFDKLILKRFITKGEQK